MPCSANCCAFGHTFVPDRGAISSPIVLVGENPGFKEVEMMMPFMGPAGRKLMEFLAASRVDQSQCYFTNTVHCREEGRKPATPNVMEIEACHPVLMDTLKSIRPKVVVVLGNTALSHFYPGFKVGKIRGTLRQYEIAPTNEPTSEPTETQARGPCMATETRPVSFTVIPTYHPSAVLHGNKSIIPLIIEDLSKINSLVT